MLATLSNVLRISMDTESINQRPSAMAPVLYKHQTIIPLIIGSAASRPISPTARSQAGVFPGRYEHVNGSFSHDENAHS